MSNETFLDLIDTVHDYYLVVNTVKSGLELKKVRWIDFENNKKLKNVLS